MAHNFSQLPRKLQEIRRSFADLCRSDVPGILAARTYADTFRRTLQEAFSNESTPKQRWALLAVGGFGRSVLSFLSDIDLLFLHQGRMPRFLHGMIRDFTYCLWDAGFEVGHATCSVSEVKRLVREDFSILTSYLRTRLIAGDQEVYDNWRKSFLLGFGQRSRHRFLKDLIGYRAWRLKQYGESSYLLEPHVKEGVGGLRDLHVITWTSVVFSGEASLETLISDQVLARDEELWLEQAHDFLWRVRLQLHQLTGRRQDQLLFPEQEQIAEMLGFSDTDHVPAVEAFMRLYYRHTARVRRTTGFCLERLEDAQTSTLRKRLRRRILPGPFLLEGKRLYFKEPELVNQNPQLLMQFFWQAAKSGAHFHHRMGHVIRSNLAAFMREDVSDPRTVRLFFDILLDSEQSFPVLKAMLETGFLEAFLPEFAPVRFRVQHDVYHLYTVDEHLLRTVRELHRLENGQDESMELLGAADAFAQIQNRKVLFLAALLHDIGKGQGKNHSRRGAEMAAVIGPRLGLDEKETELLGFLILNHLILAETALKRDLSDEKPVFRCALEISSREHLHMLYLLTIADSRATGPSGWNTWKASLLRELYVKVGRLLRSGEWHKEDIENRCRQVRNEVLALLEEPQEQARAAKWLDSVAYRYLVAQAPEAIVDHFRMEQELKTQPLALRAQPGIGEMWQITVATRDRPGLFAIITGVLFACGLNILSADIYTRRYGIALDVLTVERLPDPLREQELIQKVRSDLAESLQDRTHLDRILEEKRRPSLIQQRAVPRKEDRVVIDEDASDFYTVIEVYTWDRPGVLHAITQSLFELGLTIQLAKISTPGAQVADVFYVTELDGNKLLDPAVHDNVRERLLACLAACQ